MTLNPPNWTFLSQGYDGGSFFLVIFPVHQNWRSPRARLCPADRGHGQSLWTETPRGGGECHCCMLGAGRPEVE